MAAHRPPGPRRPRRRTRIKKTSVARRTVTAAATAIEAGEIVVAAIAHDAAPPPIGRMRKRTKTKRTAVSRAGKVGGTAAAVVARAMRRQTIKTPLMTAPRTKIVLRKTIARARTMEIAVAAAVAVEVGAVAVPKTVIRTWTAIATPRTKARRTMTTGTQAPLNQAMTTISRRPRKPISRRKAAVAGPAAAVVVVEGAPMMRHRWKALPRRAPIPQGKPPAKLLPT